MKATAHIQVTLSIPLADVWYDGTDIAQIRQDAKVSGLKRLDEILQVVDRPRVVGEPKVTIVLLEDLQMVAVLDADDDDADNTEEGPFIEGDDDERQMEPEEDGDDQDENE